MKNENIFGLLGVSGQYRPINKKNKSRLIEEALYSFEMIDTASVYGGTEPINDLLGNIITSSNSKIKIINKIGASLIDEMDPKKMIYEFNMEQKKFKSSNVEAILLHRPSLKLLKRDLEFLHYLEENFPDINTGLCTNNLEVLRAYTKKINMKYLQIAANLIDYNPAVKVLRLAKKLGIITLARSVLSSGIMARKYNKVESFNFKDSIRRRFTQNKANRKILKQRLLASDKIFSFFIDLKKNQKIDKKETFERFIFALTRSSPYIDKVILGGTTLNQINHNSREFSVYPDNLIEEIFNNRINEWSAPYI